MLDDVSTSTLRRSYATIPRLAENLSQGFIDIALSDMARCVNALAWWLQGIIRQSDSFETLCYIGVPDIRSTIFFLAAIMCGYTVCQLSSYIVLRQLTTVGSAPFS